MLAPALSIPNAPNPYSSITGAQEALGIVLNSTETRRAIADEGFGAGYEVQAAARSSIFQVTARSGTSIAAEDTAQAVLDWAAAELATRQADAGLSEREQFRLEVLEAPTVISVIESSQARVQAVIGLLGAGLSVLIAVLFDDIIGFFRRFRARRRKRRHAIAVEADVPPGQLTLDDIAVAADPQSPPGEVPVESEPTRRNGRRKTLVGGRAKTSPTGRRAHPSVLAEHGDATHLEAPADASHSRHAGHDEAAADAGAVAETGEAADADEAHPKPESARETSQERNGTTPHASHGPAASR